MLMQCHSLWADIQDSQQHCSTIEGTINVLHVWVIFFLQKCSYYITIMKFLRQGSGQTLLPFDFPTGRVRRVRSHD